MWLDGAPIDPAATYTVGMNSFLASGGDNFVSFGQGTSKADSGKVDLESMVDYFEEFGSATPDISAARRRREPARRHAPATPPAHR